jgi:hypothetical protein
VARDIADVERELRKALDAAVARGAKPIRGTFGDRKTDGCALGLYATEGHTVLGCASLLFYGEETSPKGRWAMSSFVAGWDGEMPVNGVEPAYLALGRRLAAKYVDKVKP